MYCAHPTYGFYLSNFLPPGLVHGWPDPGYQGQLRRECTGENISFLYALSLFFKNKNSNPFLENFQFFLDFFKFFSNFKDVL